MSAGEIVSESVVSCSVQCVAEVVLQ